MNDLAIQDYLDNGGVLFNIKQIDTLRDGGTKVLQTNLDTKSIYIDKNDKTLHAAYPTNSGNKITDQLEISYIKYRLQVYTTRLLEEYTRTVTLCNEVQLL